MDTTIPDDFFIPLGPGASIVVPVGAEYLVVGVLDSFYADNTDPGNSLGVDLKVDPTYDFGDSGVPEPSTVLLLLSGLAGLYAFRRIQSRRRPG